MLAITPSPGLAAQPLVCQSCGRPVLLPAREDALLDEDGVAYVVCPCGRAHAIPFESPEPVSARRRRGGWQIALLWLVILGLIVLLLPMLRVEPAPEPAPDPYLTT